MITLLMLANLHDAADIAQLVIATATAVGVIASMYLSTKALREVQRDREARQAPFLAFEIGGWRKTVDFVQAGAAIPGFNPRYVARVFPNLPLDAESVRLRGKPRDWSYGTLKNLGAGAA